MLGSLDVFLDLLSPFSSLTYMQIGLSGTTAGLGHALLACDRYVTLESTSRLKGQLISVMICPALRHKPQVG